MKQAKIIFLRHGECEGGEIARGQIDVALTALGREQMHQAFNGVPLPIKQIFSSPLVRCQYFADVLSQQLSIPVTTLPALQEINFGVWDGQTYDAIYQASPSQFDAYWKDPWHVANTPENGESLVDFSVRVQQGLMAVVDSLWQTLHLASELEVNPQQALVVTHGGVMRCIMAHVLNTSQNNGLFANLAIPYAAIMSIDVYWTEPSDSNEPLTKNSVSQPEVSFRLNWPQQVHMAVDTR
ncbi:histidine phosphatase family protein [Shewanella ulleungensis]|jgi:alpha-ribazole phosphatase|uniref:Phosphoglycerate mutase n=1 Tax=Shewanella ulleungensis TaxID=2282699 RepID=A0ABQ2QM51_9GAMM|nr:histidine phosphatase family protein [Shewanella ulleungensis]MCL1150065.1 histidine phosphatase family protein [Shewanella ulleungensis]GGP86472.1 phosphoglycerate mutase [Shewanella ulleungensis]